MTVHAGSRQILLHGMLLVLVGLLWGLAVPGTPYPRLALGAHIQLVTNGMLFIVLATALLALPHGVGIKSVWVMVAAVRCTSAPAAQRRFAPETRQLGVPGSGSLLAFQFCGFGETGQRS